jgi:hypothetical protein
LFFISLCENSRAHCVIAGRQESIKGFIVGGAVLAAGLTLGSMYVPAVRRVPWRLKLVGGCSMLLFMPVRRCFAYQCIHDGIIVASVAWSGWIGESTMTNCRLGRPY